MMTDDGLHLGVLGDQSHNPIYMSTRYLWEAVYAMNGLVLEEDDS